MARKTRTQAPFQTGIRRDRVTGDYAVYLDGDIVGYRGSYEEGETLLNGERLKRAALIGRSQTGQ